jgi:hypothetical protein
VRVVGRLRAADIGLVGCDAGCCVRLRRIGGHLLRLLQLASGYAIARLGAGPVVPIEQRAAILRQNRTTSDSEMLPGVRCYGEHFSPFCADVISSKG